MWEERGMAAFGKMIGEWSSAGAKETVQVSDSKFWNRGIVPNTQSHCSVSDGLHYIPVRHGYLAGMDFEGSKMLMRTRPANNYNRLQTQFRRIVKRSVSSCDLRVLIHHDKSSHPFSAAAHGQKDFLVHGGDRPSLMVEDARTHAKLRIAEITTT
ncbi:hypothetical protein PAXINDRAFT_182312 [Paxillus involutus ATCC 200175]|uniref:Uncharacterized protein n=1 Tax=Paxillus involutus ATCC 200175 TaxID=664439 RepID=A0A0C9SNP7_PAXIN|nr:hypothetical protein PAXINDRAFT_182312 [Paxillus involutus ATCC 200175]